jgi:hypothetical protein
MSTTIPKIIFIIPYRDRPEHLQHFKEHMKHIMEDHDPTTYKYVFAHQCDTREFNRGAMKNIGFIAAMKMYPNDYKNITFVFHDVDTTPVKKNVIDYITTKNVIKHFYGFTYTLGGIVSILGSDFERIGGFPNFWGWGYEDNLLQRRAQRAKIIIDRSVFYEIGDTVNMVQHTHGNERKMNKFDMNQYFKNTRDGLYTISELRYNIDDSTDFINITGFKTMYEEVKTKTFIHDLNKGNNPREHMNGIHKMQFL